MSFILASWKSALVGVASVVLMVVSASQDPSIGAMIKDPKVQIALLVGLLGLVAKDNNVTGGTSGVTPEAEVRVQKDSTLK